MLRLLTSTIFIVSFCPGVLSTKRCLNGGTRVSNEVCACAPGWAGTICGEGENYARVRPYFVCNRYFSPLFSIAVCQLPCRNGGVCSQPNTCACAKGWSGKRCNTPVCPRRCKNRGRCIFNPAVGASSCACVGPWRGDDCSMRSKYSLVKSLWTDPYSNLISRSSFVHYFDMFNLLVKICFCPGGEQCSNSEGPIHGRPMCCRTQHVRCFEGEVVRYTIIIVTKLCHVSFSLEDPNSAGGDPHFLIYLPDDSKLCFSVQGEHGFAFNLVTSKTLVINAVFIKPPPRLQHWASLMGEIGLWLMGQLQCCHNQCPPLQVYCT